MMCFLINPSALYMYKGMYKCMKGKDLLIFFLPMQLETFDRARMS